MLGFDLKNCTASIIDSGNEPFSATNVETCARAVASILQHPGETENRYMQVMSFVTTQNEVLSILEEDIGTKFKVENLHSDKLLLSGDEKWERGDPSAFVEYSYDYIFADGAGHAITLERSDNHMLGLQVEDLKSAIRKIIAGL
jgi:hypothetical protein